MTNKKAGLTQNDLNNSENSLFKVSLRFISIYFIY